ncbi:hypothetical protein [Staphylococcus massiliensis]|uniref:Uncharacterized protein n=1 Tax=Staphylococcus massiliensis S46 TaxID=1229783 RepID=K9ALD3_9STAP|nr:hypothetical protein [Staphylococcus massiliensis]EKU48183.1 hypothetical protein C273_05737 [Staphylococcus massiliensis S46]MCG3402066.1 hypothetical protein [Staphylococcus massiliensis]MCG3412983.1 hypothetical protein [Staphylococcus massiliensis]POA00996.1 hypothetical protein CD133_03085 [Staphylococcus massiliensis CCUG 55927]
MQDIFKHFKWALVIMALHALTWLVMLFLLPSDIVMQKQSDGRLTYTLPKLFAFVACMGVTVFVFLLTLIPPMKNGVVIKPYRDQLIVISMQVLMLIVSLFIIINALIH